MNYAVYKNFTNSNELKSLTIATDKLLKKLNISTTSIDNAIADGSLEGNILDSGESGLIANGYNIALSRGNAILALEDVSFSNLMRAKCTLSKCEDAKVKLDSILEKLGVEYSEDVAIVHILDFLLKDENLEKLKEMISTPLKDFKVAIHYGERFATTKKGANLDRLSELIELLGAEVLKLDSRYSPNGYQLSNIDRGLTYSLSGEILLEAFDSGADMVLSLDSTSLLIFDKYQKAIECRVGRDIKIPVLNLPQLILLATGERDSKNLGFEYHKIAPKFI